MKKVLCQKNIWREAHYDRFLQALMERDADLEMADVVPFTTEIVRESSWTPDLVFGSNRFINLSRERGWPVFKSFLPIEDGVYPADDWINGNGYWCRWGDLEIIRPQFLKPKTEKFFTGCVVESQADLEKVQLSTSFIDAVENELVWVCDLADIRHEARFFVVGGSIVTGSRYRINGQARHARVTRGDGEWQDLERILQAGFIDDAFAIDLGLVGEGWKIVEINNLNSAGIYDSDVDALASALLHL
ncbi:ATP-grasp domain-containing protein [Brevifollis gellanilyticus]|uniref:ATP-grasp domain-containing protein n=1 Tax=Brevifollis gellanilyticus TaxID=748831 RepID=A0A512ME36_9BACT|nr:ATP-grasp domain-containing protein [Brevifollis gellanilyticus]GEP44986.1 hypothetical protein BGE01nite_42770 [Brevifollis gellanilyticus]